MTEDAVVSREDEKLDNNTNFNNQDNLIAKQIIRDVSNEIPSDFMYARIGRALSTYKKYKYPNIPI
jgi:hypothetical protein